MPLITLTTDFGTKDHFVGSVKGAIYNELKDVDIVDISFHHKFSPAGKVNSKCNPTTQQLLVLGIVIIV